MTVASKIKNKQCSSCLFFSEMQLLLFWWWVKLLPSSGKLHAAPKAPTPQVLQGLLVYIHTLQPFPFSNNHGLTQASTCGKIHEHLWQNCIPFGKEPLNTLMSFWASCLSQASCCAATVALLAWCTTCSFNSFLL